MRAESLKSGLNIVAMYGRYPLYGKLIYCGSQVNWDASKLLTQKNKCPELGRRMLTQKAFGTILIIFLVSSISLTNTVLEINFCFTVHSR